MEVLNNPFRNDFEDAGKYALTRRRYLIGLSILFASAYLQYLVKGFGPVPSILIIYGIPVSAVSFLFGSAILHRAFRNTGRALKLGLSLFGLLSLSGLVLAAVILTLILSVDPKAANLLQRPNPVLHISPEFAWIMVWLSIALVGPAEEYLFRGFVYGGLLSLFGVRHWLALAVFSSALFALAHLYYALVYGIASLAMFAELLLLSISFAITYYLSGGNLLIPTILHGLYDATGFIGVAVSQKAGIILRMSMTGAGIAVALILFARVLFSRSSRP